LRLLCLTEAGDQLCIHTVSLSSRQLRTGIGFGRRRVDNTHLVTVVIKVSGKGFRVTAGGFQTSMNLRDMVPGKPFGKLREARDSVSEDSVTQSTIFADQTDVEL
jgi:hypothetical protein